MVSAVAASMGLTSVQVFVSPQLGKSCLPCASNPPTLVVGDGLVAATNDLSRAFLIVRSLKLVAAQASALVRLQPSELGVLLNAFFMAYNPGWTPQGMGPAALAEALRELLAWRAANTPAMMIEEALAAHVHSRSHTLTFGGGDGRSDSVIACELGWCEASLFGLAREGGRTSSFNGAGGTADTLAGLPQRFGIARMMRELEQQVNTQPLGERFVGEVVLAPGAVDELLSWLMAQLGDGPLIDGSSIYRERVGQRIASPLLTLQSRFDAPGCVPVTADAFVAPATTLLDAGVLTQLTPSLYGSRKTGLPHRPVAAQGWELRAGSTPLAEIIASVARGALVDRLSMGEPAPNGDFAGVIKNSFALRDGRVGAALAETMITGNVAQMLQDVRAVSRERIDGGSQALPWLCIGGLSFS